MIFKESKMETKKYEFRKTRFLECEIGGETNLWVNSDGLPKKDIFKRSDKFLKTWKLPQIAVVLAVFPVI